MGLYHLLQVNLNIVKMSRFHGALLILTDTTPFTAICFSLNWESSFQIEMANAIPLLWYKSLDKEKVFAFSHVLGWFYFREVELSCSEWISYMAMCMHQRNSSLPEDLI